MAKRKTPLVNNEYYHIYNRGVAKMDIFTSEFYVGRFLEGMQEFNTTTPIGSIYEHALRKRRGDKFGNQVSKLVDIVAYCLNPNHYHFILRQIADNGISKFMKSLGGGYTKFFNEQNERSGPVFQGKFQSVHIESNEQLLFVGSYVNLNYVAHGLSVDGERPSSPLIRSSWDEYLGNTDISMCEKDIILEQFQNVNAFRESSLGVVGEIARKREEMKAMLLE